MDEDDQTDEAEMVADEHIQTIVQMETIHQVTMITHVELWGPIIHLELELQTMRQLSVFLFQNPKVRCVHTTMHNIWRDDHSMISRHTEHIHTSR